MGLVRRVGEREKTEATDDAITTRATLCATLGLHTVAVAAPFLRPDVSAVHVLLLWWCVRAPHRKSCHALASTAPAEHAAALQPDTMMTMRRGGRGTPSSVDVPDSTNRSKK